MKSENRAEQRPVNQLKKGRKVYSPLLARSETHNQPVGPIAFDCVKLIVIRAGSARLFNETAFIHVNVGDVVVLAANTLCGAEPEGRVTTTTIYLDSDYVIDQIFWQYAAQFRDRLDASDFLDEQHSEPTQLLRIGEESIGQLTPWLDELVALSVDGLEADRFYRAQALLSAILDVVVPHFAATSRRERSASHTSTAPSTPRHRIFQPLRTEARIVAEILASELDRRWSTAELADAVNLSPSQLRRVFVEAFGKSPLTYLAMLRAERMAQLLKTTDAPISVIAASVGWGDPDFAAQQFRRSVGVAPSEYRRISRKCPPLVDPE